MAKQYGISEEAYQKMEAAPSEKNNWIVFDRSVQMLESRHVEPFLEKGEAISFAAQGGNRKGDYMPAPDKAKGRKAR